jgi:hypothetical protein
MPLLCEQFGGERWLLIDQSTIHMLILLSNLLFIHHRPHPLVPVLDWQQLREIDLPHLVG